MADENGGEVTPLSVSAYFDETHKKYLKLVGGEEETGSPSVQTKITDLIRKLEDLTRQVSVLGILSENENYKEMNPTELKFILLPFMMGNLWQLSTADSRDNVCQWSKVYFRDYLRRCHNYDVISKLPPEAKPDEDEEDEEEERSGDDGTKKTSSSVKRPPPKMNSDDVRAMKVQRFKEAKALDEKINLYLSSHLNGESSLDDEDLRIFVVSLLKRSALDAEDQLRSIAQEFELIKYAEKMRIGAGGSRTENGSSSTSHSHNHPHNHSHSHPDKQVPKKKPHIFILTKSEVEKQVFGTGYPAIPVMTVDELYEQRRKTGQWGHIPSSANMPPVGETDDDRDAQREQLEEREDEEQLARQRQMDDYKDEHRTGWGNRYNRS